PLSDHTFADETECSGDAVLSQLLRLQAQADSMEQSHDTRGAVDCRLQAVALARHAAVATPSDVRHAITAYRHVLANQSRLYSTFHMQAFQGLCQLKYARLLHQHPDDDDAVASLREACRMYDPLHLMVFHVVMLSCRLTLSHGDDCPLVQDAIALLHDTQRDQHLLVAAFARLGLAPLQVDGVDTHSWELAAAHADEFDLLWSVTPLSPAQLGKLSHRHKVNQLPGHDLVVSPAKRYGRYITLQGDHGRYEFNFMPPEFYFPRHKGAFVKAFEAMRGMARFSDRVNADPHFKRRWLVTKTAPSADPSTAAVTILTDPAQLEATPDQQLRIVHVVEPMLFSGHKAHVGVFVVVSSIDPLRIYIYHNVLLRMSVQKYPAALDSSSPRESFEVSDTSWLPPWEVDDLKAHYTELPSTQSEGTSHLKVLLRHLEHVGVDVAKFHKDVYSNVVKTIAASRGHFAKQARQASPQPSIDSFFQLFRFDMEIDDFGKPWVVSVQAQPSLKPQHFGSGSTGGLFSALTTDLVRLVGVLAPRDKTSAQLVVQVREHTGSHGWLTLG
ncbi:hypothetical protein B5M09_012257, partial [Aphanomyces astaci]